MTREESQAFHKAYPNRAAVQHADTVVAQLPDATTTVDEQARAWIAAYEAFVEKHGGAR